MTTIFKVAIWLSILTLIVASFMLLWSECHEPIINKVVYSAIVLIFETVVCNIINFFIDEIFD